MSKLGDVYLREVRTRFRALRQLADRAAVQIADEQFFAALDQDGNSVALLMKHVGGNLRSRWTDVFTTDGEKPDRDRDGEFERRAGDTRGAVLEAWARGWAALEGTLEGLTEDDLVRAVVVRGEEMSALEAIGRSLAHTAQHVGQIVLLARHLAGSRWQTLSIPKKARA